MHKVAVALQSRFRMVQAKVVLRGTVLVVESPLLTHCLHSMCSPQKHNRNKKRVRVHAGATALQSLFRGWVWTSLHGTWPYLNSIGVLLK